MIPCYTQNRAGSTHCRLYVGEFVTKFENILENESGAKLGLFDEKTRGLSTTIISTIENLCKISISPVYIVLCVDFSFPVLRSRIRSRIIFLAGNGNQRRIKCVIILNLASNPMERGQSRINVM
jgi:hypothetical protein